MSAPSTTTREVLSVAVCLYDHNAALDFQGPVEFFGMLAEDNIERMGDYLHDPKVALELDFLSVNYEPVVADRGPRLVPTALYSTEKQYDVLFVGGGSNGTAEKAPKELLEFLKKQAPGARYVLTACTGSWILAGTGLLDGRRATTNKWQFNATKAATSKAIEWVPKARWVVDGKFWSSSGITAGMDMANGFLIHLVGEETAKAIKGVIELAAVGQGDDEYAAFFGLV